MWFAKTTPVMIEKQRPPRGGLCSVKALRVGRYRGGERASAISNCGGA
jgi:hypothetical protein